ncbi:hypothetical protein [Alteribacter keqinensis]|uniref:hypothetical protein n=1 Tax=Alteribacter keqinensis TaxID=2483800 RepID=UPI0016067C52|nr:hypothetical protein [Alteribacter keqinensis]
MIKNIGYFLMAVGFTVAAFFTGEIITFVMLGLVLMSLHSIHMTLKKILAKMN